MTIEQAKDNLDILVNKYNKYPKDYYGWVDVTLDRDDKTSMEIAIKSLNMCDKVVELINTKYGHILKATKYGNEDAEQHAFSYSNVLMYEVADILDDILDDIEEYKKEIEE